VLRGDKVGLRARREDDIPVLRHELFNDVVTVSRSESRPWQPVSTTAKDRRLHVDEAGDEIVPFSVVELAGGQG